MPFVCCYIRDESASATFVLRENQEQNGPLQEWIPFHVLDENDNEFELRNNQVGCSYWWNFFLSYQVLPKIPRLIIGFCY